MCLILYSLYVLHICHNISCNVQTKLNGNFTVVNLFVCANVLCKCTLCILWCSVVKRISLITFINKCICISSCCSLSFPELVAEQMKLKSLVWTSQTLNVPRGQRRSVVCDVAMAELSSLLIRPLTAVSRADDKTAKTPAVAMTTPLPTASVIGSLLSGWGWEGGYNPLLDGWRSAAKRVGLWLSG